MKTALALLALSCLTIAFCNSSSFPDQRPVLSKRTFTSTAIDNLIEQLFPLFKDPNLARMFSNCLPNTLDTTIYHYSLVDDSPDSFIITGDIEAMWLRDSQNQLMAYIPYAGSDSALNLLIRGAINRQASSIMIDSFANSFNYNASGAGHQNDVRTPPMTKGVFEGKYELDSLMSFLKLSYWHYRYGGVEEAKAFATPTWLSAVEKVLNTVTVMISDDGQSSKPVYLFSRETTAATDTLMMSGRGPPGNSKIGLSRQLFRPSDDAVTHPYNIPGNIMACIEIRHLAIMLADISGQESLLSKANSISETLGSALAQVVRDNPTQIPYEIDGYGSKLFMDDANVPSLLSIPLLGYMIAEEKSYQKTRRSILSAMNPYFYSGKAGEGIGGPHVGPNYVWPMSIVVRAMTSSDETEIKACLDTLLTTTAGTGLMHESFLVSNSSQYTRPWFAWANGLFGELILQLIHTHPSLVLKDDSNSIKLAQQLVKIPVSLQVQLDSHTLFTN